MIGRNEVSVPRYYYKVILDYTKPEQKGIGFIMPNRKLERDLEAFTVTIDSVESFTGLDFFPQVPEKKEEQLESSLDLAKWEFAPAGGRGEHGDAEAVTATRCLGETADGSRCKRKTKNGSGYCWQHE